MIWKILIGIAVVAALALVVVVGIIAMKPNTFRVARSVTINAPAAAIFPHVNDFHLWKAWSPYEKLDPEMKRIYNEVPAGLGAQYSWNGNDNVGEGGSTITAIKPDESIQIQLAFIRPFQCNNDVEFSFKPVSSGTEVTWAMTGESTFMYKLMDLIIGMDNMVGGQFAEGLNNLKTVVEQAPTEPTPAATTPSASTSATSASQDRALNTSKGEMIAMATEGLQKPVSTDREILIERIIAAPREKVFAAWTNPEQLPRWYAPTGCTVEFKSIEVRPGGKYHSCIYTPTGYACWCIGEYLEVVAPERLVLTMTSANEQGQPVSPASVGMPAAWPATTTVTITFAEHNGQTKLTLHQTVSEALAKQTGAYPSWLSMFERLSELVVSPD